jgi:hypothetical protein
LWAHRTASDACRLDDPESHPPFVPIRERTVGGERLGTFIEAHGDGGLGSCRLAALTRATASVNSRSKPLAGSFNAAGLEPDTSEQRRVAHNLHHELHPVPPVG